MVTENTYRKAAVKDFREKWGSAFCVYCGFGVEPILEVAHLDQDRKNNDPSNLVLLCPTCHKMHDVGLIPTSTIRKMRSHTRVPNWKLRIKDAGQKAKKTRMKNLRLKKHKQSTAGKKSWDTRRANAASKLNN